mmetsp:Transcript_27063/g.57766  ORF Transcript_27063/g.57766 Transcript_27063/m.57766 type:complete len:317 (-) Transcript_27063:1472-2422(-)
MVYCTSFQPPRVIASPPLIHQLRKPTATTILRKKNIINNSWHDFPLAPSSRITWMSSSTSSPSSSSQLFSLVDYYNDETNFNNQEDEDESTARSQFGTKSYWNEMYQGMGDFSPEEYSWYYGWEGIAPHVTGYLDYYLLSSSADDIGNDGEKNNEKKMMGKEDISILIPGCGNDPLLLDLYNSGYRHLTAFDYSPGAIDRQRDLMEYLPKNTSGSQDSIRLSVLDARNLPSEWTGEFDVVIEKGALDAIYLSGDGNFEKAVLELTRVVKRGGICVSVSGVVEAELRKEVFGSGEAWDCLRDGGNDLKAGCFIWRRR